MMWRRPGSGATQKIQNDARDGCQLLAGTTWLARTYLMLQQLQTRHEPLRYRTMLYDIVQTKQRWCHPHVSQVAISNNVAFEAMYHTQNYRSYGRKSTVPQVHPAS
jgi:hypothetical protein